MAKTKDISRYNSGMLDLIEAICERKQSVSIPLASLRVANSQRFEFYGLIGAMRHNEHTLAPQLSQLKFLVRGKDGDASNSPRLVIEYVQSEVAPSLYSTIAEQLANPTPINDN